MLNSFTIVVRVIADAMGTHCGTVRRRIPRPATPETGDMFDLVSCKLLIKVCYRDEEL
jgi:hypothetical protein